MNKFLDQLHRLQIIEKKVTLLTSKYVEKNYSFF